TCSFDCIYCQLGRTVNRLEDRKEFVSLERFTEELTSAKGVEADYATFSGMAEPTLASNLGEAIQLVKSILNLPVAVLTNSSTMPRPDARRDIAQADVVVAKVDAPNEQLFQTISRPVGSLSLDQIIHGLKEFRRTFKGKLALQMMFMEANREYADDMARLALELSPDEIQLNTPLRPCAVKPLSPEEMVSVKKAFADFGGQLTMVYDIEKPTVTPIKAGETRRRRPE
ncbi:MAG: radical SAM protein, partial [Dehalococcoidia bacterium]